MASPLFATPRGAERFNVKPLARNVAHPVPPARHEPVVKAEPVLALKPFSDVAGGLDVPELMAVFDDAAASARGLVVQRKTLDQLGDRVPRELADGWARDAALTLSRMADAFELMRNSYDQPDQAEDEDAPQRERMRG